MERDVFFRQAFFVATPIKHGGGACTKIWRSGDGRTRMGRGRGVITCVSFGIWRV